MSCYRGEVLQRGRAVKYQPKLRYAVFCRQMPQNGQTTLIGLTRCYNPSEIGKQRVVCVCFLVTDLEPMTKVLWSVKVKAVNTGETTDLGENEDVIEQDGATHVALRIPSFIIDPKGHEFWLWCNGEPLGFGFWGPCPF